MAFIRRSKSRSFDLLSSFSHYTPGWKGLAGFCLLVVLGFLLSGVVTVALMLMENSGVLPAHFSTTYGMLISYPVMFIPAMIYARSKSSLNRFFETGYAIDSKNFSPVGGFWAAVLTVLFMLGLIFATDPVSLVLPDLSESVKAALEMMMNGPLWVTVLSVCIFAPIFEEWLCRGIVLRSLLRVCKPWLAIVISALFFALIHGNLWQGINAFIIGCAMGFIYYRTGSLKLTILMHFVNNSFSTILGRITDIDPDATLLDLLGGNVGMYVAIVAGGLIVCAACVLAFLKIKPLTSKGSCVELPAEEYTGQ